MNSFGNFFKPLKWCMAMVLAAVVAGCGGGGGGGGGGPGGGVTQTPAGAVCSGTGCVDLASSGTYVMLSEGGIVSGATASTVSGNVGVNSTDAGNMTGFAETMDPSNTFATSSQVTGRLTASDYAAPTPDDLNTAIGAAIAAFGVANAMISAAGPTLDGSAAIAPGVYNYGPVTIAADVTLSGSATDVWVLQVGGALNTTANIILAGGARPENVFWAVNGAANIGPGAQFNGVILTGSDITVGTGAVVKGRLIAGGGTSTVSIDQASVTRPAN